MKTFTFRGITRVIGTVKQPSDLDVAEMRLKGWFHELLGIKDVAAQGPTPPASVDYITPAKAALATMLANDRLGDCVIAEDLHLAAMRAAVAGAPWEPTDDQAISTYSAVTGYTPSDPSTDQGTDPLAMVRWRLANPYPDGTKLLDARLVDGSSLLGTQQAVWLATGCLGWASLPDACESEEGAGDIWDAAGPPNPDNGHGFGLCCYVTVGGQVRFRITTWGEEIDCTPAFVAKYMVQSAGGGLLALIDSRSTNATVLDALDSEATA